MIIQIYAYNIILFNFNLDLTTFEPCGKW